MSSLRRVPDSRSLTSRQVLNTELTISLPVQTAAHLLDLPAPCVSGVWAVIVKGAPRRPPPQLSLHPRASCFHVRASGVKEAPLPGRVCPMRRSLSLLLLVNPSSLCKEVDPFLPPAQSLCCSSAPLRLHAPWGWPLPPRAILTWAPALLILLDQPWHGLCGRAASCIVRAEGPQRG